MWRVVELRDAILCNPFKMKGPGLTREYRSIRIRISDRSRAYPEAEKHMLGNGGGGGYVNYVCRIRR